MTARSYSSTRDEPEDRSEPVARSGRTPPQTGDRPLPRSVRRAAGEPWRMMR
jgi:hypothetical protein